MTTTSPSQLLQVADAVAREKAIDREEVLDAMEQAIQKAGRTKYGHELDIRAHIDRKSGDITLARYRAVVEEIEDGATQILLDEAHTIDSSLKVGDFLIESLPPIDFGRIAAQPARQVIMQKLRDAERQRQYAEFKDRIGEIINGLVKRVEFGNVVVDLGRAEGILRREEVIPRENIKVGDRTRSYIMDVRPDAHGPLVQLSRTHPQFMAKLFAQEVPEIYEGVIEIKSVARDPGSRAKIAVTSDDKSLDPVGACVGMRGSRVQAVVNELQGEKVDIIPWAANPATFIVNALAPAEITKVVVEEDENRVEVIVPDEQLSLAIGRRGQNVRLASKLTGWDINILTESEESKRRTEELRNRSQLFMKALDVDEVIAHLLVAEGFTDLEEVAFTDVTELLSIEGFDEDIALELQQRAKNYLDEQEKTILQQLKDLGISEELQTLEGLSTQQRLLLANNGIKTMDDLGDLASDELRDILGSENIGEDQANQIIMRAREHWFTDDNPSVAPSK